MIDFYRVKLRQVKNKTALLNNLFYLVLTNTLFIVSLPALGNSSEWGVDVYSDDFSGKKACVVEAVFEKNSEGRPIRVLEVPVDGQYVSRKGNYLPYNYRVIIGSMATVKEELQLLIDGERASLDDQREKTIKAMQLGSTLKMRYSFRLFGSDTVEERSVSLEGFKEAWTKAQKACDSSDASL